MNLHDLVDSSDCNDTVTKLGETVAKLGETDTKLGETVTKLSEINYLDSIEYLKYSNQYLHDKLIIANKQYKEKYQEEYKFFKELKLIGTHERYTLEYYIKTNYRLVNKLVELNSKKLQEKNLCTDPKKIFTKKKIHEPIRLLVNIKDPTIRGTLYDKALSYLYDKSIDFLTVVRSCKSVDEIDDVIVQNKIINSDEMLFSLFGNQLDNIKHIIDDEFSNMSPCKIIYSHDTKTYGYPDFIADNWIIDIKTSKTSVLNMKNYLQVIGYAICADINNICLYDVENGYIYKAMLKSENIKKIKMLCFNL
jgi:hypothetical protein